jgi:prepilin-type N-terminal cleavage/methylation domain-containing protein
MEEKGSTAMKLKNHRRTGAFTLVEIMIVVAIIGLLAAIAIPNFVRARETAQANACVNNLRQIDGAKQQWALENGRASTDTPDQTNLVVYLKAWPRCPANGTYAINAVSNNPTCSIGGKHSL